VLLVQVTRQQLLPLPQEGEGAQVPLALAHAGRWRQGPLLLLRGC
jgi:hypothetical protein